MLTVERAIEEVGHMENISKHTSTKCFDFGDKVLLLYVSKNVNGLARDDAEARWKRLITLRIWGLIHLDIMV